MSIETDTQDRQSPHREQPRLRSSLPRNSVRHTRAHMRTAQLNSACVATPWGLQLFAAPSNEVFGCAHSTTKGDRGSVGMRSRLTPRCLQGPLLTGSLSHRASTACTVSCRPATAPGSQHPQDRVTSSEWPGRSDTAQGCCQPKPSPEACDASSSCRLAAPEHASLSHAAGACVLTRPRSVAAGIAEVPHRAASRTAGRLRSTKGQSGASSGVDQARAADAVVKRGNGTCGCSLRRESSSPARSPSPSRRQAHFTGSSASAAKSTQATQSAQQPAVQRPGHGPGAGTALQRNCSSLGKRLPALQGANANVQPTFAALPPRAPSAPPSRAAMAPPSRLVSLRVPVALCW